MNLADACMNCNLRIRCLEGSHCQRLREFGLSEGTDIIKVSEDKNNIICTSCGTKMVVSKVLGKQIIVND